MVLVEEDASVCRAISRLLALDGLDTLSFRSPEEAMASPHLRCALCLVADVASPDADGSALVERIAALGLATPVILITSDDGYSRHQALASGAGYVIEKPFDSRALLTAIHAALAA